MAVWCNGGKEAWKGGTDNGEILRRWSGAKAARSRAQEERAVERLRHGRSSGIIAGKGRTVDEQAVGWAERCKGGMESSTGRTGGRETDSWTV